MAISKKTGIIGGAAVAIAMVIGGVMLLSSTVTEVLPTDSLQSAISNASCGDTLVVQAGAAYVGPLTLPAKGCTAANPITIQSSRAAELPAGVRVTPQQSALLAKLQSATNAEPVIKTVAGASGYKFVGVDISTSAATVAVYHLVRWGGGRQEQAALASVPRDLSIDRSWIHGWPTQNSQAAVTMNCANCSITNSYVNEIHSTDVEAQAVIAWNGTNGVQLVNNYLEGAGENVMIGGADSASAEMVPANIEIRRNHLFKPLSWKEGDPSYAGRRWIVKNLLELKAARNVVIDANVMENIWVQAQDGSAVLFTVRNQECHAPWSTVENATFTNNIVKNVAGAAVNLLGKDNEAESSYIEPSTGKPKCGDAGEVYGSIRGTNATFTNNVFDNVGGAFLQLNGFDNVTLKNNTHRQRGNLTTLYGEQSQGLKYVNNVTEDHDYGIYGEGASAGTPALQKWAPGSVFAPNVIAKPYDGGSNYPTGNQYPAALVISSDYRTPYTGMGADPDAILAAQAGVIAGPTVAPPSPSPSASATVLPSPTATASVLPSPTATQPLPSPSPSVKPSPSPSPAPSPVPCLATSWPSSVAGQNSQMSTRRAQGCYPVRRTNNGMEYTRP
jgi:hypothetical protein